MSRPILENQNNRKGLTSASTATSTSPSSSSSLVNTRSLEISGPKHASRRKKRSFKIGYGRDDFVDDGSQNGVGDGNNDHGYAHLDNNNLSSVEVQMSSQGQADVSTGGLQGQLLPVQIDESSSKAIDEIELSIPEKSLDSAEIEEEADQRPSQDDSGSSIHVLEREVVAEENRGNDVKRSGVVAQVTGHDAVILHDEDTVQIEKQSSQEADSDTTGKAEHAPTSIEAESESAEVFLIEKKLDDVKVQISSKLKELHERAASISMSRKVAAQRRRQAAEEVNVASNRHKELEKELEEACEREDFERAETLSESLLDIEKSKQAAIDVFRSAEADCDSMALAMQEILEAQVQIEEEGIKLLECLQKDAEAFAADLIKKAENMAEKEMEKWVLQKEALELQKMEVDFETKVIEDADEKLKESIDDSVRDDIEEKKELSKKRDSLMKELQDLLALVKAKEDEISENDSKIQDVENRISGMVSKFQDECAVMKTKSETLMSIQGQLESNSEILSMKKMDLDKSLALAETKKVNLIKLAGDAGEEARVLHDLVALRKSIASSFMESRENKVRLAKKEQQISEEVEDLRQEVAAARLSLQELSSAKANLNQEITSMKQKILFIEKRGPELEAEKKVAAAARNFKEAGRVAAEAKKLSIEKDTVTNNMEKALSDLQNLEEEINGKVTALQEAEDLIMVKEREAAKARCERLRLVAASAREEWSTALEVEDLEEAGNLLGEAEAADSEADKLQKACSFDGEQFMKISKQSISVATASTLMGKQLTEKSSCVQTNVE
ncbi:uncharacterized protein LOC131028641 isoform X2 [Cryptomeria japonica]|uniref:uncharacterized protein LOC131028641 isoform X2 n=1 Tax=Cryptomeria japonica TaxID=3369 RepID=UPI0027D9DD4A|nr:uncharacterized protein LOC131028641 isoform X2 [Cryptomeria japonica]